LSEELKYSTPVGVPGVGENIEAAGVRQLLLSSTPNARVIFKLLATAQLEDPSHTGLTYQQLFQLCRENFVVMNEHTMRAQLKEFKEHKVLLSSKGADDSHFIIPVNPSVLKHLISEL
jgi:origin recognition complex subunit 2